MRKRMIWLLLAALLGLVPSTAQAQYYEVPPVDFTGPLSHPAYNDDGIFGVIQFMYMRETRPLHDQAVAYRGFFDTTGFLTGTPGAFVGSHEEALNTNQLRGLGDYQPGFNLMLGYRFHDGLAISVGWWHLAESTYHVQASLLPESGNIGTLGQESFLSSPVFNFPIEYAGNPQNIIGPPGLPAGATLGIWNAASLMKIDYLQRFEAVDVTGRIPVYQNDCFRTYGLIGPKAIVMYERFKWQAIDYDINFNAAPETTADYTNIVSNRLYGVHAGGGTDCFLGDTPIGGFSFSFDCEGALYLDFVKERAKYFRDDRSISNSRSHNTYTVVPSFEAKAGLWWYPWEAVQVQLGYNFLALFDTVGARDPVDFNYGGLDPTWNSNVFRWIHGVTFGVGLVF